MVSVPAAIIPASGSRWTAAQLVTSAHHPALHSESRFAGRMNALSVPPAAAAPCSQSGGRLAIESARLCAVASLQTAYAPAASDLVVVLV